MENKNNKAIIQGLFKAVNTKNFNYFEEVGDTLTEWLDVPFNLTSRGKNAIHDPWKSWFDIFPDATCEVQSMVDMGDTVIARGILHGTHNGHFQFSCG